MMKRMGCKMRKRIWKCKKAVFLMAAVMVLADRIPGLETGMMVYATEKRMPKELVARKVEEPEEEAAGTQDGEGAGTQDGKGAELTAEDREIEEKIDAYFDDVVFVGDSIMLGFRNYAMKRQDTFLSRMQFLAAGSYSANNSLWDLSNKESVHPVYKGEPRYAWDSIAMMGSGKVFIMLGMNDLNVTGLEGTWEKYEELLGKIEESVPGVEIHIMSMTYVLHGKEVGKLENNTIREYNNLLEEMAEEHGYGFINIADALADDNGDLAAEYCSDEFAHQNPEAYDVWVSMLRTYAKEQLEKTEYAKLQ